jgi:membrane protein implicated in regulation of membrane protease activity
MVIYAAIAVFGFLLLLVMLVAGEVFGGDHDIGAHEIAVEHGDFEHAGGPSVFSLRIMSSFLTAFGVGGVVARYYNLSHPAASGVGIVAGIIMSSLVYQFARILYSQQASSEVRMSTLVGKTAEVLVGIPEGGVGQVTLTMGGERTDQIARSANGHALARGTEVMITAIRGDSVVVAPVQSGAPGGAR